MCLMRFTPSCCDEFRYGGGMLGWLAGVVPLAFCNSWSRGAHACPSATAFPPAAPVGMQRDLNNMMETDAEALNESCQVEKTIGVCVWGGL